jgi:hypothetical protein
LFSRSNVVIPSEARDLSIAGKIFNPRLNVFAASIFK